jgi:pimeloyl-ACP methyl ester carboxylesterase
MARWLTPCAAMALVTGLPAWGTDPASTGWAQSPPVGVLEMRPMSWAGFSKLNLPLPTLGGTQFWGDVRHFRDYRIQHNVLTNHYRLLDPTQRRMAFGSREDCEARLLDLRQRHQLAPLSGHAVLLLHGITRSSAATQRLKRFLSDRGYLVMSLDYPSTQVTIPQAAEYLHQVVSSLDGAERISIVGHSLGGLVTRAYFAQHQDPRMHRVVMLGTPNQGAELADRLQSNWMYQTVFGPAGQQLVTDPLALISTLPLPPVECGVIAGGRGDDDGWNPLIPGDDDGVVTVASTQLSGTADFLCMRAMHHSLLSDPSVAERVACFLETGRFSPTEEPPTADAASDAPGSTSSQRPALESDQPVVPQLSEAPADALQVINMRATDRDRSQP